MISHLDKMILTDISSLRQSVYPVVMLTLHQWLEVQLHLEFLHLRLRRAKVSRSPHHKVVKQKSEMMLQANTPTSAKRKTALQITSVSVSMFQSSLGEYHGKILKMFDASPQMQKILESLSTELSEDHVKAVEASLRAIESSGKFELDSHPDPSVWRKPTTLKRAISALVDHHTQTNANTETMKTIARHVAKIKKVLSLLLTESSVSPTKPSQGTTEASEQVKAPLPTEPSMSKFKSSFLPFLNFTDKLSKPTHNAPNVADTVKELRINGFGKEARQLEQAIADAEEDEEGMWE